MASPCPGVDRPAAHSTHNASPDEIINHMRYKFLVFPDVDAYESWKEKFKARPQLEVYISDYLQKNASPQTSKPISTLPTGSSAGNRPPIQ